MKNVIKIFLIIIMTVPCFLIPVSSVFAQVPVATLGPIVGVGPFGEKPPEDIPQTGAKIVEIFSMFLGLMTSIGGLLTFAMFVMGGLSWITSSGDKANMEKARNQITNGIIGLVIIVASWAVIAMISGIFGLKILQVQDVLQTIFGPKTTTTNTTTTPIKTTTCPGGFSFNTTSNNCCDSGGVICVPAQ
jgi:hypothetical protein